MAHLYASFADAALAEKAAGALLDYGVLQQDISLVAHEDHGAARQSQYATPYDTQGGAAPGAGYGTPGEIGMGTATGAAAGLGTASSNVGDVGTGRVQVYDNPNSTSGSLGTTGMTGTAGDLNPLDQGGPDSAVNAGHAQSPEAADQAAKHGISTTTPEDAGEGAVKGTGIGLGVGILASLAALTIPGVGIVLGAGALASALGATALAAGAGAIAGGATGYLKDQGVPHEAAERYHGTVEGGGAVLSVNVPSGKVDQATASAVLSKYGASDVNAY